MDLQTIRDLVSGYRQARIFQTGLQLELFEYIGKGATAHTVSARAGTDPRATKMVLNALVGMDIIQKRGKKYYHTELSRKYLFSESRESIVAALLHSANNWENWSDLPEIVRTGSLPERERGFDDPERHRTFILAMHDIQKPHADKVVNHLDVPDNARILDCGGGPGTYSRAFAAQYPSAQVVLLDLPEAIKIAQELTSPDLGLQYIAGDFFQVDLEGEYDLIFLSNIIHSWSAEANKTLLERLSKALRPAGQLILRDRYLDETGTKPVGAAVFAIHMLVNNLVGQSYPVDEVSGWLTDLTLRDVRYQPIGDHSELILARN